jgi:hypothetical protein
MLGELGRICADRVIENLAALKGPLDALLKRQKREPYITNAGSLDMTFIQFAKVWEILTGFLTLTAYVSPNIV